MSPALLLKLLLTPALISGATLVGRRWGDALGGFVVGLPLTSGPVIFFLALEQGTRFAAASALGVILGVASQAVFAVAYVRLGSNAGWMPRLLAGTATFACATAVFRLAGMPAWSEPIVVLGCLIAAILVVPIGRQAPTPAVTPCWDLPLRVLAATALVLGLTAIAPLLGARLSGLILPFPLYAAILAVFAHHGGGARAAAAVWRGLLFGLFSFLAFFSVLAAMLVRVGIGVGFLAAIVVAIVVQGVTLVMLRSTEGSRS
jgi:hypothetical protein